MKQLIRVTQVFRVEKSTVIEVEADSLDDALEIMATECVDLPSTSDAAWKVENESLASEDYQPA